jgi:hypothetical protein
VREATPARRDDARPTGVVDTLSAGYGIVNRRPWIVLIPILFDLALWFGPQVSVSPLVGRALAGSGVERGFGADDEQAAATARQAVLSAVDEVNLLALATPSWISVPSITPLIGGQGTLRFVDSWATAFGLVAGSLAVGVLVGCIYRSIIAQQVRDAAIVARELPRQTAEGWPRLVGLVILLGVAALLVSIPLGLVLAAATLVARELASLGVALVMTLVIWGQFYFLFAPDAIFVSRVGPLAAVRRSVAVVRAHFWAAVRIAVLTTIILLGMGQVWLALARQAPWGWGPALGILGNAYIASGLVAASMIFYRERDALVAERRPVALANEL